MKRIIVITIAALCCIPSFAQFRSAYSDLQDSETVRSFREHISYISSAMMEGRAAGSEGERETATYISQRLEEYGVNVLYSDSGDTFGMKLESGDTLTSRNVVGIIEGYDKQLRDRYIVIGARMDNIGTRNVTVDGVPVTRTYYGANGNASGLAMMLELARMLRTNALVLKRSVVFVAFGASLESNAGAWYFLNRSFQNADKIDAMINLDVLGTGDNGFYAFTSSNADLNAVVTKLNGTLQPIRPEITALEPIVSDHRAFYAAEIPSVFFTSGAYPEYGSDRDTPSIIQYEAMERELEYIYSFSVRLANGTAPVFNPNESKAGADRPVNDVVAYHDVDYRPSFLGSTDIKDFLEKWVYAYLKYPEAAVQQGIQGRVLVDFVVDERGKVRDVKVLKGVDELLDAEAVKVISASPDWRPGRLQGKKVKTEISLYIEFKLEKKKK